MDKFLKVTAAIIIIVATFFGAYKLFFSPDKEEVGKEIIKADEKNQKKGKTSTLPVKVVDVIKGDLPLRLPISAQSDVWEKAVIKAQVNGNIKNIHVKVGQKVKKGQLLIKIDDKELILEQNRAKANKLKALSNFLVKEDKKDNTIKETTENQDLKNAKEKYLKAIKDFEKGKISQKQLDLITEKYERTQVYSGTLREEIRKAQDGLTDSIISLKKTELNLERSSIRAPFNGVITDIKCSKGAHVSSGTELIKIINLSTLYLKGYALESEKKILKKGTKLRIKFDSYPNQFFKGRIDAISPEVDPKNKTITVFANLINKEDSIFPGMHAQMDIEHRVKKDILIVPRKAIVFRQDRALIFIVNNNVASWKYVELGEKNDLEQEIISDEVKAGDKVVVEGQLTLGHLSKVKIVK